MKSLVKNSVFNTVYTVLNLLFPLITSVYVSRVLMPEGVGKVAYTQSIASYFVILASLGLPNYGIREIAKIKSKCEKKNKLFTELIIINTFSTAVSLVIYMVLILCNTSLREQTSLFLACGFLIFLNFLNIDWLYQGEEEYVYIVIRSLIVKALSLAAIFLLVRSSQDFIFYAWISSFATGGNYIFNSVHARKYVKLDFRDLNVKQHILPILVMAGGVLLSSIYGKIDTTMLGIMSGEKSTGLYTYGQKIIDLVISLCTAVTAVFMPRLSYYYEYDTKEFHGLLDQGIKILAFLTFPMAMGLFIIAPEVIEILFGAGFIKAAVTVRIFCVLIIIKGFGNLLCFQLVMCTGNEKERLPATFLGSIVNIFLNIFLIPLWAEAGAAVASVISEIIVNSYQLLKMKKKLGFHFNKNAFIQAIISTVIMAVICFILYSIRLPLYFSAILVIGGGAGVYLVVNIILKNEIIYYVLNQFVQKLKRCLKIM